MIQLTSLLNRQRVKISLDRSLHWVYLQRRFAVQLDYGPMHNSAQQLWQTICGCRQAKMFLHGPDKKLSRYALKMRYALKILVGLLTGHITLNRHLTVMKIQEDPLCSACREQEETSLHFWGNAMLICKLDIPFLEHN